MSTYLFRPISSGSSMPRPTDTPPLSARPLLAASLMPAPPPVLMAYPARARPPAISSARWYSGLVRRVRAEPKIDTARPSSASRPNPSTNSAWMRMTRHGSVCTQSAGPRRSSRRWSVVVCGIWLPRSVTGPWRRSRRCESELTVIVPPTVIGPGQCLVPSPPWRPAGFSGVNAVVPQNFVQRGFVVAVTLGQPPQHQHAGQAELAAGELAGPGAADAHRPGRRLTPGQFLPGLGVDHVHAGAQDRARAQHRALTDPGPFHDHAPGADEGVVTHHHRHRVRRLEHAADADSPGQVDVLADLGAGPDRGPGVD